MSRWTEVWEATWRERCLSGESFGPIAIAAILLGILPGYALRETETRQRATSEMAKSWTQITITHESKPLPRSLLHLVRGDVARDYVHMSFLES